MDKYLDELIDLARNIGTVETLLMNKDGKYTNNEIIVTGVTRGGLEYTLQLKVEEKKNDT